MVKLAAAGKCLSDTCRSLLYADIPLFPSEVLSAGTGACADAAESHSNKLQARQGLR